MIINFFLGGSIFTLIEYIVNHIQNPALAAIISMIPIGYLSIFIIDKRYIKRYVKNIFFVVCVTMITTAIFYGLISLMPFNKYIATIIAIILWIILQSINYNYNPFIRMDIDNV